MDTIRAEIHAMIETAIHDRNLASRAWVKGLGATDTAIINEITDHISKLHNRITTLEGRAEDAVILDEINRKLLKRVDTLEKQVRKLFAQHHVYGAISPPPSPGLSDEELSATLRALISKIEQRRKQDV
jgi:hypothetical protein